MGIEDTILAVDIGGTNTKVGIAGAHGSVADATVFPTGTSDPEALVARIRSAAPQESASGVGVSVAGFLNDARDRLIYNPISNGW